MIKRTNFEKLYKTVLDSHEEMMNMFEPREIERINKPEGTETYTVYASDRIFSGWGHSQGMTNHVLVICWSRQQKEAIYASLCERTEMTHINWCSLEHFIATRSKRRGTWSLKNANDCYAWNKEIKVEV